MGLEPAQRCIDRAAVSGTRLSVHHARNWLLSKGGMLGEYAPIATTYRQRTAASTAVRG